MRVWLAASCLILIHFTACSATSQQKTPVTPTSQPRYLALGDSYTIGEALAETGRWPVQLVARLRAAGQSVADPEIIARTGWTTDELSAAIDEAAPVGPYSMVSLLIGVNDQYRGHPVSDYEPGFRTLLDRAAGFAGGDAGRVIVVSIPDWGVTPFAEGRDAAKIAQEIDAYNSAARRITLERGAHWVDVTAISRLAADDRSLLAEDGLHPSTAMYASWVREIEPEAVSILQRR